MTYAFFVYHTFADTKNSIFDYYFDGKFIFHTDSIENTERSDRHTNRIKSVKRRDTTLKMLHIVIYRKYMFEKWTLEIFTSIRWSNDAIIWINKCSWFGFVNLSKRDFRQSVCIWLRISQNNHILSLVMRSRIFNLSLWFRLVNNIYLHASFMWLVLIERLCYCQIHWLFSPFVWQHEACRGYTKLSVSSSENAAISIFKLWQQLNHLPLSFSPFVLGSHLWWYPIRSYSQQYTSIIYKFYHTCWIQVFRNRY